MPLISQWKNFLDKLIFSMDQDYDNDNEEMEPENTCPECGEYKNSNRKACDSCIFTSNQ